MALPRFCFPKWTGCTFPAPLQRSSIVPSMVSPSAGFQLSSLPGSRAGSADSGDTQPCGVNDLDVQRRGQRSGTVLRVMLPALLGGCKMSHCPSACGNRAEGNPGEHLTVRTGHLRDSELRIGGDLSPVCALVPVPGASLQPGALEEGQLTLILALTTDGLWTDPKMCLALALAEHMSGLGGQLV